jgi:hypothetical protein
VTSKNEYFVFCRLLTGINQRRSIVFDFNAKGEEWAYKK